jgi:FkbM family methyltransferase
MDARRLEHLATLMLPLHGKTVLETGAGIGDLTTFFLDRGCTVTSLEPRRENVELYRSRYRSNMFWPPAQLRIEQGDVYRLADRTDIPPHQAVFCYGLLYHLDQPQRALQTLARLCTDVLLLETAVAYGVEDDSVRFEPEDPVEPTNSITGTACYPSRRWVFNRLAELFEHVTMPLTQPYHEQFRLDWRQATPPPGRSRAIFIASRAPLRNPLLVPHVPLVQFHDLPQPGALSGVEEPGVALADSIFGPLLAYHDDLITQQLRSFGAHTRNELAMLLAFVDAGDLVYDVGAHIGTFALPLAAAVGSSGRVIAIEADRRHFALLRRNLESRRLARNGSPLQIAIADAATTYGARSVAGNSGATWLAAAETGPAIATARLDDVHAASGETRRVALIKIDVEGMELSVLNAATAIIDAHRPLLYLEISANQLARHGATPAQIDDFLRRRSYRLFRNAGERNSNHDRFQLIELPNVAAGGEFYDLLAIPTPDARLARAQALVASHNQARSR